MEKDTAKMPVWKYSAMHVVPFDKMDDSELQEVFNRAQLMYARNHFEMAHLDRIGRTVHLKLNQILEEAAKRGVKVGSIEDTKVVGLHPKDTKKAKTFIKHDYELRRQTAGKASEGDQDSYTD